ncbi:PorT family protein [Parabacteroides sp. OttesenSCG-928-G21]|nr:PorT family protein [Parabacteroides sp. OttesenSCG-928-G21]
MKKKLCLLLLMMSGVLSVSAQFYVTPEIGITAFKDRTSLNERWNAGWKAGAAMEYQFKSGAFALQSGLYYANRATDFHNYPYLDTHDQKIYDSFGDSNNHYLQIPLLAKFNWQLTDKIRMNVAIGPYVGLSLSNTGKGKTIRVSYDELEPGYYWIGAGYYYYGYANNYGQGVSPGLEEYKMLSYTHDTPKRKNDWGMMGRIGFEVDKVTIGVTYDLTFRDGDVLSDFHVEHHTFGLSVGYKLKIGK